MSATRNPSQVLRAAISPAEMRALRVRAAHLGVTVSVLAGQLIRHGLEQPEPKGKGEA